MKKIIKPALEDPHHSIDLFDGDRINAFGEIYCIAPAILPSEVNFCWKRYERDYKQSFQPEKPFGYPGSGRY